MGRSFKDCLLCLADPFGDFAYFCSLYFGDLLDKLFKDCNCFQCKILSLLVVACNEWRLTISLFICAIQDYHKF